MVVHHLCNCLVSNYILPLVLHHGAGVSQPGPREGLHVSLSCLVVSLGSCVLEGGFGLGSVRSSVMFGLGPVLHLSRSGLPAGLEAWL